tara:strand:+ start:20332 stop:20733 length:402 start_codon:yes stop_codon:yes gene_type:complete
MPKIKIEIEISGEEIVGIISGLLEAKMDHSIGKKYASQRFSNFSKTDNPYQVRPKQPLRKKKAPVKKGLKKKANPKGKHARKGGWTQLEVAWLQEWIATKPVNKVTGKAFRKKFGYVRSLSSLSNKAFALRKK